MLSSGNRFRMKSAYSNGKVFVDTEEMTVKGEHVTCITGITTRQSERGKGHASRYLRSQILPLADEEEVTLVLAPNPSPPGLDLEQLTAWYERLGFVMDEEGTMWRLPHAPMVRRDYQEDLSGRRSSTERGVARIRRWHPDRYRSYKPS